MYCNNSHSIRSWNPCKEPNTQSKAKVSKANAYANRANYQSKAKQSKANPCANRTSFFKQTPNKVMQVHVQKDCSSIQETRGVSHCGLAIYIKMYLKVKKKL
jgi:uncharacterized Zn-finger protein